MFPSINRREENMVTFNDEQGAHNLNRSQRAEHFIKMVRALLKNCCVKYYDKSKSKYLLLSHQNDMFPDGRVLGCVYSGRYYLNCKVVYEFAKKYSALFSTNINVPKELYFVDSYNSGIITAKDRPSITIEFDLDISGTLDKYICIANSVLGVRVPEPLPRDIPLLCPQTVKS